MCQGHPKVDLGFTEVRLPAGTHICQIYSEDEDRDESLLQFLLAGLKSSEFCACFSENIGAEKVRDRFSREGISLDEVTESGALILSPTDEVYFKDNRFDPDRMLAQIEDCYVGARASGYPGVRIIGEMSPTIDQVPGGSRLIEYESRVNLILREHPITAICQYNANEFDGATIMDVLKVHPMMIVRGNVVMNPYFVAPSESLTPNV